MSLEQEKIKITLVRHGQTDWNVERKIQGRGYDIPLNEFGQKQANDVAEHLRMENFDVVITSSLKRSIETGQAILKKQRESCKILKTSDFDEVCFGEFEGETKDQEFLETNFHPLFKTWESDPNFPFPDGESPIDAQKRMWRGLERIIKSNNYQNICVVGHGFCLKLFLMDIQDIQVSDYKSVKALKNAGISLIEIDENMDCEIIYLNKILH